ncbi:MAG TPA: hypothetical protein VFZ40_00545 [Pyrinomonadaceae bacterium]
MSKAIVFRILIFIAFISIFFPQTATGQVNQYARDGLSFSYPADWPLTDESDAAAQTLNLDRGKDEAKIMILALRQQLNPSELGPAQARVTEALVSALVQELAKVGAQPERSAISESIGGVHAQGIRLRATVKGEPGNIEVYWLTLGGRSVHLVYIGSDQERIRANHAWHMVISTLRVGGAPVAPPVQSRPPDLTNYAYRQITGRRIELYMDQWGRGFVHDLNNNAWVRIPDYSGRASHHARVQDIRIQIHPSFCKTSDTMALMYAFGGLLVYDSSLYTTQDPNQAWRLNYEVSQRGQAFASISRTRVINHIAQVNDVLALAAGTNWICIYDLGLHKWVNYQDPVDDSTAQLDSNLVLSGSNAQVKILNGPFCNYTAGTGSWRCLSRR